MKTQRHGVRRALRGFLTGTLLAGILPVGFLESCNNRLTGLTQYVDPCGTILNCTPGSFQVSAADVGDYCIDPSCTVPGMCDTGQPLGTITRICP